MLTKINQLLFYVSHVDQPDSIPEFLHLFNPYSIECDLESPFFF